MAPQLSSKCVPILTVGDKPGHPSKWRQVQELGDPFVLVTIVHDVENLVIIKQRNPCILSHGFCGQGFMKDSVALAVVLFTQLCPTLCSPRDCSLTGSSDHGISSAKILGWISLSFSRGSSWPRGQTCVSCLEDFSPLSQLGCPRKGLIWVFLTWGLWNSKRLKQLGIRWASFSQSCFRDCSVTFPHGLDWASSQHAGLKGAGLPTHDSEF